MLLFKRMTRLALAVLLGLLGAVTASAQPVDYCLGRVPRLPDEFEGRDPSALSLTDALDALLDRELDTNGVASVLGRAILHAEPQHEAQLKAIVEAFDCKGIVESRALVALVFLGEPSRYFTSTIEQRIDEGNPRVSRLVEALAVRPQADVLPEYHRLRQRAVGTPAEDEIVGSIWDGVPRFEALVRRDEQNRLLPITEQADEFAWHAIVFYVAGGLYNAETGEFTLNELGSTFDESHAYAIDRLREIAWTYPTLAEKAVDRWLAAMALGQDRDAIPNLVVIRPSALTEDEMFSQEPSPQDLAAVAAYVRGALPDLVPPLAAIPPVMPGADVQPGPVCVEPRPGGTAPQEGLTAVFSYTSDEPDAVRVPYGSENGLTGSADDIQDAVPPEVFFPDTVETVTGRSFRVPLRPAESVTWTLSGRSVTADANSPRCGA